ncbi:MAG TPA: glycosyltransferase family 4 protein [Acidobacteriota bacterium]|nr:glycosyltransferase family 4 protein [Acidobacteriota bacterium]
MIAAPTEKERLMRIAYVVPMTWSCGGIVAPFAHVNELIARGHEVAVFAPDNEPVSWFPLRTAITIIPGNLEVGSPFDAVIFVGDSFRKVHFPAASRRFLLLQGKDYLWVGVTERASLLKAYADPQYHILAVSNWLADFVRKDCVARRVSVIGNGVDTSRFYPERPQRAGFRLLIEGNLPDPNKNVLDALEIARRVRQHENVEVWAMARRFMSAASLVDRLFEDPTPDAIPEIYRQCDLLVKTSIMEGFGLPHLEAMACGCVPVTYSSGGVLDYCRHDENSLVAGVGNIPLMVWNSLRFLSDRALRTRLQANAVATARSRPWSRVADQLESAISEELRSS